MMSDERKRISELKNEAEKLVASMELFLKEAESYKQAKDNFVEVRNKITEFLQTANSLLLENVEVLERIKILDISTMLTYILGLSDEQKKGQLEQTESFNLVKDSLLSLNNFIAEFSTNTKGQIALSEKSIEKIIEVKSKNLEDANENTLAVVRKDIVDSKTSVLDKIRERFEESDIQIKNISSGLMNKSSENLDTILESMRNSSTNTDLKIGEISKENMELKKNIRMFGVLLVALQVIIIALLLFNR